MSEEINTTEETKELTQEEQLEQFNKELAKQPSEVQAVVFLKGAIPKFETEVNKLTAVEVKQVLRALIRSPLEEVAFKFETKQAHRLFNLGTMIANAKFVLFSGATTDAVSKIIKETHNVDITPQELRNLVNEYLGEPLDPMPEVKEEGTDVVTSETNNETNSTENAVEERENNGN